METCKTSDIAIQPTSPSSSSGHDTDSSSGSVNHLPHYFWSHNPHNVLSTSYLIGTRAHTVVRLIFMAYFLVIFAWCLITQTAAMKVSLGYMTFWGFYICTAYFILIHFVRHSADHKRLWKVVYFFGEIAVTLEFIICPFFFAFIFSEFLHSAPAWDQILREVCLHLICPVCMWIEMVLSGLRFPMRHLWVVLGVVGVYTVNNLMWTKWILGSPVYTVMTWDSVKTLFYLTIAFTFGVAGYLVANWQARRKEQRAEVILMIAPNLSVNDFDDEQNA